MELLPLVCLCLLTWSGTTFADGNEPKIIVLEGSDATLPCSLSSRENIGLRRFEWKKGGQKKVLVYDGGVHSNNGFSGQDPQFKDRVSYFEDELKNGNASITIRHTKLTDSGDYTCEFPGRQETSHIKLVVDGPLKDRRGENIPGVAANPSVTSLKTTKDWVLLQCVVQGASPKPEVVWQDSSGHNLTAKEQVSERGGCYDITLKTNVTKTDNYTCVATQKEINHRLYAWTDVYISGFPTGWIVAVAVILGTLFVVGVVLAVLRTRRHRFKKGLPRDKINGRAEKESFPVG